MARMSFGGVIEDIVTREEYTLEHAREALRDERIVVVGYGVQGPAQSLNLRDNGFNVRIGLPTERTRSWEKAIRDGWVPGDTLLPLADAVADATIVLFLVSDAGQRALWPSIEPLLGEGDAIAFSHGFSVTYSAQTGVVPPPFVDVILVAPKGSGTSVRANYLAGSGINSSTAVHQDHTGRANERALAIGIGIGSGFLFPTTFEKEVHSDLTGERGILMGALAGVMEAQYETLRTHGHSPSEAFNETVEELTQSLIRLVGENGMDWMYANCSATAQRGALDWRPRFKAAVVPVFEDLYSRVIRGEETRVVLEANGAADYQDRLDEELRQMRESEMWQAGKAVRSLRPENTKAKAGPNKGDEA
jgi:ketol-acid reductoisomerase